MMPALGLIGEAILALLISLFSIKLFFFIFALGS
jgi:hypothetical protein